MEKELIDYSYPLHTAESRLRACYNNLLAKRHDVAMEDLREVITSAVDAMLMIRKEMLDTE